MLPRTFSVNTTIQVKNVLDDIVSKVVKQHRRVTWSSRGITSVRTFVPEPWRKVWRKPISYIREADIEEAVPFTLPPEILTCEPFIHKPRKIKCELVPLPRTTHVSLDMVYKIAKELNKIDDMDMFIEKTSAELQHGVKKS